MANRGELNNKNQNWPTPTSQDGKQAGITPYQEKDGNHTNLLHVAAIKQELNWPTARTSDGIGGLPETEMTNKGFRSLRVRSNQWFGAKLKDAVETLHNQPDQVNNNTGGNHQESLQATKNWATPQASDYVEGARTSLQSNQKCLGRDLKQLEMVDKKSQTMRLNPRWVEVLMGLPVGWCMPSCVTPWITEQTNSVSLEMELCQPQQLELF
jgi:hypothetical protein